MLVQVIDETVSQKFETFIDTFRQIIRGPRLFSKENFINFWLNYGYNTIMVYGLLGGSALAIKFFLNNNHLSRILKASQNDFNTFAKQFENVALSEAQEEVIKYASDNENGLILKGKTGSGKSTIASKIAEKMAAEGAKVYFFSNVPYVSGFMFPLYASDICKYILDTAMIEGKKRQQKTIIIIDEFHLTPFVLDPSVKKIFLDQSANPIYKKYVKFIGTTNSNIPDEFYRDDGRLYGILVEKKPHKRDYNFSKIDIEEPNKDKYRTISMNREYLDI